MPWLRANHNLTVGNSNVKKLLSTATEEILDYRLPSVRRRTMANSHYSHQLCFFPRLNHEEPGFQAWNWLSRMWYLAHPCHCLYFMFILMPSVNSVSTSDWQPDTFPVLKYSERVTGLTHRAPPFRHGMSPTALHCAPQSAQGEIFGCPLGHSLLNTFKQLWYWYWILLASNVQVFFSSPLPTGRESLHRWLQPTSYLPKLVHAAWPDYWKGSSCFQKNPNKNKQLYVWHLKPNQLLAFYNQRKALEVNAASMNPALATNYI